MWCIPPEQSAAFVAKMENVLKVYKRPYDPKMPVICMDEKPYQLLGDKIKPIPMKNGSPKKIDFEYERNGTCCIFVFTEPLKGWRRVAARERRTRVDFAQEVKRLLTVNYPDAPKICLVLDNLNTHSIAALYQAFPPEEASAYADRLELHFTPAHGSWLNIAEIELSVLARQCLKRRVGTINELNNQMNLWSTSRNASQKSVDWQYTTKDARVHLKRLYPIILQ